MSHARSRTGTLYSAVTSRDRTPAGPGRSGRSHLVRRLQSFHYWVVLLDEGEARLCIADGGLLREIEGHGLPLRQQAALEDEICQPVHAPDSVVGEFIGGTPWPIVVAGPSGPVACFCATPRNRDRVVAVARGTYPGMPLPLVAALTAHAFWKSYRCGSYW